MGAKVRIYEDEAIVVESIDEVSGEKCTSITPKTMPKRIIRLEYDEKRQKILIYTHNKIPGLKEVKQ